MKFKSFKSHAISFTALVAVMLLMAGAASAQQNLSAEEVAQKAEERVRQVLGASERSFTIGLDFLSKNQRTEAKKYFNEAVENFLKADLSTPALEGCQRLVVETVFRIEYPANDGSSRSLIGETSRACGWNIKSDVADAAIRAMAPVGQSLSSQEAQSMQGGFGEQKHEISPLDDLAKLELTREESDIDTPQAREQFRLIESAVSNRSLGFSFQVHPMIQQFINYYQGRGRSTMATGLYRSGMFMRMARRIFKEEGVPENVVWLAQVESAWKPSALSWAAASGLWQFIPSTGARYGLKRTAHVDERNGFEGATRASAKYLKFLANRYNGNWELALAAYNSGEGNVDRAIQRAGVANFWIAYQFLPRETRNYVPNILATILIANNPNQYGFGHVKPAAPLVYDRVKVPSSTSLGFIAQAANTSVEYLRYLNPELRSNITPPESYVVRVPASKGNDVLAKFKSANSAPKNDEMIVAPVVKTTYQRPADVTSSSTNVGFRVVKIKKGDNLSKLAREYGITVSELANLNGFDSVNAPLQIGKEIKVPVSK